MVASIYQLFPAAAYPDAIKMLEASRAAEDKQQRAQGNKPYMKWVRPEKQESPDPITSTFYHMHNEGLALPPRKDLPDVRPVLPSKHYRSRSTKPPPAPPRTSIKVAKKVPLRAGATKDDVLLAQTAIKSKLSIKYRNMADAFRTVDKDGSGTLTRGEVSELLKAFMLGHLQGPSLDTLFDLADKSGDGSIDYEEFAFVLTLPSITDQLL